MYWLHSGMLPNSSGWPGQRTPHGPSTPEKVHTGTFCQVNADGASSHVMVDAYPLDALERKLLFGARKGVTETAVTWFFEQMEKNL